VLSISFFKGKTGKTVYANSKDVNDETIHGPFVFLTSRAMRISLHGIHNIGILN